ncbi:dihydropteroate synthase [Emticicia sp. TH156]|uniref:dihydropteroate synthase n=1 Tax=Emticicia sp. TH156 TaxID=2067454 RepID=UPI000C756E3C|nr:dihydropteroate synthase [Emticicia sp. TH156]PLK42953.1 dihydropteroate synthase [Emticicia sp. TH156]
MSTLKSNALVCLPNGRLMDLTRPSVMGILNVTPDSFFEGSRYLAAPQQIVDAAGKMLEEGASILDIGGYSTRPHAADVSIEEETERILNAIEPIAKQYPNAVISIDTFRSAVAEAAVKAGASIINDIAGGNLDSLMFGTVAELAVPYILMHSRGNPSTMSRLNDYHDPTVDVLSELQIKVNSLRESGVKDIIIDPGFGFAKDPRQGFEMLKNLPAFQILGLPMMVGVSRKSMIWKTLGITASAALNGTTALNMVALMNGANILRVHDVIEAMQTIRLYEEIYGSSAGSNVSD